jgi:hypothetical protein
MEVSDIQEWEFAMSAQTLTLEAIKDISLEDLLARVLRERQTLTIRVSNDQEIVIAPQQKLKPLPVLDGYVPQGWKDAIYDIG